jgi:MFS family permease
MLLNRPVKILLYGSNLWYFGEGLFGPLFTIFAQKIGGSVFDLTWAWGVYLVVAGLNIIIVGKFADSVSKSKLMMIGYALNAGITFFVYFCKVAS